jgi:hypothetical protein
MRLFDDETGGRNSGGDTVSLKEDKNHRYRSRELRDHVPLKGLAVEQLLVLIPVLASPIFYSSSPRYRYGL